MSMHGSINYWSWPRERYTADLKLKPVHVTYHHYDCCYTHTHHTTLEFEVGRHSLEIPLSRRCMCHVLRPKT